MSVVKFILHVVGWLVTIVLQIAVAFLIILLLSIAFAGLDTTSRMGWLLLLFFIWMGYVIGINLVGYGSLRWVLKDIQQLPVQRLIATMAGAILPLLILIPIGYGVPVGDEGSKFSELVTNNWQPILTQVSLFAAILGYYVPGVLKFNRTR